jgi:integrase/recombinase XerD
VPWQFLAFSILGSVLQNKGQLLAQLEENRNRFERRFVGRKSLGVNPAASVRGERYSLTEGKTPEITVDQERALLASIGVDDIVGLPDRAIAAVLIYTAARIGAVAGLDIASFAHDGTQWSLRFLEKGGKVRDIPARADLQCYLTTYLDAAGLPAGAIDSPVFRGIARKTTAVTAQGMTADDMGRMLKRRMSGIGLPTRLSPHSFRVATITDLLSQGVPLEEVQNLVGHADPRTTRLYDRRQKKVMRSVVDKISV